MIKNSTNINKTKESLNSDGEKFHQYQQNKRNLNSDGEQFHQYQQNEQLPLTATQKRQWHILMEIQVYISSFIREELHYNNYRLVQKKSCGLGVNRFTCIMRK